MLITFLITILQACYFILPAWVANMMPVIVRKIPLPVHDQSILNDLEIIKHGDESIQVFLEQYEHYYYNVFWLIYHSLHQSIL